MKHWELNTMFAFTTLFWNTTCACITLNIVNTNRFKALWAFCVPMIWLRSGRDSWLNWYVWFVSRSKLRRSSSLLHHDRIVSIMQIKAAALCRCRLYSSQTAALFQALRSAPETVCPTVHPMRPRAFSANRDVEAVTSWKRNSNCLEKSKSGLSGWGEKKEITA